MADSAQQPSNEIKMEPNDNLDVDDETSGTQTVTQPEAMNLDGANDADVPAHNGATETATLLESRIPAKKDATLREFLGKMDDYAPIVNLPECPRSGTH